MCELFTKLDGGQQETRLMHRSSSFQMTERGGVKAILLPYTEGEMDMAIFLPNSPKDLPTVEARLDQKELNRWLTDLGDQPFHPTILTLPRMHLEWRGDLKGTLGQMGLKAPFEPGADFSRMVEPLEDGVLGFEEIIHKTFLDVDEKGAEAAAATAVIQTTVTSAPPLLHVPRGQALPVSLTRPQDRADRVHGALHGAARGRVILSHP